MKALRWAGASLLMLLAGVLGLVGVILCATLLLLPLGIPVLFLARRLFRTAGQLVVPRAVRHPIDELDKRGSDKASSAKRKARKKQKKASSSTADAASSVAASGRRLRRKLPRTRRRGPGPSAGVLAAGKAVKGAVADAGSAASSGVSAAASKAASVTRPSRTTRLRKRLHLT